MPALTAVRFNCVQPGIEPTAMAERYQAFVAMAQYADSCGVPMLTLEEHHGSDDGWSPAPLIMAGLIFGGTKKIGVSVSALLAPLHDPLRIAEDIAVLDLASGGRLTVIVGLGYRPEEYSAHDKDWSKRGALMDECLDTMLAAWTGEPFEYRGTTVRVTPRPLTQPHPMLLVGGTSKPAARRAARHGLPMFPAAHLPELEAYYYEKCAEYGTQGFCLMPSPTTAMVHVAEDPDAAWAKLGKYFLHEATTYSQWQTPDITSAVHSHADSVEKLRSEGIYQVLTPTEALAAATANGAINLHPLVGGMPVAEGWSSLHLYCEKVLPQLPD